VTTTPKQMTLERSIKLMDDLMAYSDAYDCGKAWAFIKAELAKQREAEPIYVYEYDSYNGVHREFKPITWNGMQPSRTIALYTYPQQRNAMKVTDEMVSIAERAYVKATPGHNYPVTIGIRAAVESAQALNPSRILTDDDVKRANKAFRIHMEESFDCSTGRHDDDGAMKAALSAVASRDREDAERYRWLREHGNKFFNAVNYQGTGEVFDMSVDAARRENKP
jgi:hypothetical protein